MRGRASVAHGGETTANGACAPVDELALAVYLFLATHEAGADSGPELLVSLERALRPALTRPIR